MQNRLSSIAWPKSRVRLVFQLIVVALALSSITLSSTTNAQNVEPKTPTIPLYLPIGSEQFPDLVNGLEQALAASKLAHVKVTTADYWHPYQQGIRQGREGVYFAAPHFAAWVISEHKFVPLLRLADPLKFVVASRHTDSHFFEVNDLAKHDVCSQQALNLDFLLLRNAFDNPLLSANSRPVQSVEVEMNASDSKCDAFVVSDHLFKQFERLHPNRLIRLQQGEQFNNYVFVLHPGTAVQNSSPLKRFLRSEKVTTLLAPMYRLYADRTSLLPAQKTDYPNSYLESLEPYWGSGK